MSFTKPANLRTARCGVVHGLNKYLHCRIVLEDHSNAALHLRLPYELMLVSDRLESASATTSLSFPQSEVTVEAGIVLWDQKWSILWAEMKCFMAV